MMDMQQTTSTRGPSFLTLSTKRLALLARRMASLLRAGLSLDRTLRIMAKDAREFSLRHALADMSRRIASGEPLANAMRAHSALFTPLFVEMVEVGELTGSLDAVLTFLADHYDWRTRTRRELISGLIWPAIEFTAACELVAFIFAIPKIFGFAAERSVFGANLALAVFFALLPIIVGVGGYMAYSVAGLVFGSEVVSRALISIPFVGRTIKAFALAKFGFALKVGLNAALPIRDCLLKAATASDNPTVQAEVRRILPAVERGDTLYEAFSASSIIPHDLLSAIEVGEVSGELSSLVGRMADYYAEEAQSSMMAMITFLVWGVRLGVVIFGGIFVIVFWMHYFSMALGGLEG